MLKWSQWLYRLAVEEVPEQDYMLPLSEAEVYLAVFFFFLSPFSFFCFKKKKNNSLSESQVVREGSDITLVGWGSQLSIMEQACEDAEKVPCPALPFSLSCFLSLTEMHSKYFTGT